MSKEYQLDAANMAVKAIHNLEEKNLGNSSKFYHHLRVQPGVEDFPIFFTEEERAFLIGSPFLQLIDNEKRDIRKLYDLMAGKLPPGFKDKFTPEDFTKAKMLVLSRSFLVARHGALTMIQVPIADMINTGCDHNSIWYFDDRRDGFVVEASADIRKGE